MGWGLTWLSCSAHRSVCTKTHQTACGYRFKEVFYDEKYLAIVMEYASQGHLSAMLKRLGRLSETDARRYRPLLVPACCHP